MISVIKGITKKNASSELLINFLVHQNEYFEGLVYIGYPILFGADENMTVDALWISKKYGLIIFDLIENQNDVNDYNERQDKLFSLIDSKLRAYHELKTNRRDLAVNIEIVSFAKGLTKSNNLTSLFANSEAELNQIIANIQDWENFQFYEKTVSVIQSVVNLKSKINRNNIKSKESKGFKIKTIEDTIATLDRNQETAVIEFYDGVQRIRGLAGSGKTIVLALKAAYLHTQNADWDIAVTFNTRALKNQFKNLIERFCIETKREAPNWNKIRIVNAWGSPRDLESERGIYYDFCMTHGLEYYDFKKGQLYTNSLNQKNITPLGAVSEKAITDTKNTIEKYDVILVDEAQDLSEPFLNLCYRFLKAPKRLIYAYDELQKLNEGSSLRNPKAFILKSRDKFDDKILDVCYRNSRPLLVTAHALGFGIYRKNSEGIKELVQFFDQPQLWKELGYQATGRLTNGSTVVLARTEKSSPKYLETHSDIEDIVLFKNFETKELQAEFVADEIEKNLNSDELLHNDIIVINPIALITKSEVALIRTKLLAKGINNHIAGEFNADIFHEHKSITFTGINRAKGNEVPMVYIINAQDCYKGLLNSNIELITRRNILFTAITRSKAWVRVLGVGNDMEKLMAEFDEVKKKNFTLEFEYPSKEKINRMNLIHRDVTEQEKSQLIQDSDALSNVIEIVNRINNGESYIEDYPENVQVILKSLLK